ncbi:pyruvate dehydrogenase (acetyl-transferring) E1 component subunit alpha [Cellulomonas bogoriensis]|nr:pyruvate dehydrogenase (acetyl-transferring) E1 component subunit alpha [Cellulomonas bogoriensis]
MIQLLDHTGQLTAHPDYTPRITHLDADALRRMHRDMVLARTFDTEATSLQRQGELALFAPALGQEAAQVGSAWALRPQDYVFPSYREHAVVQARGVDPANILRIFRGIDHGGWDPADHNVHLYTLVIGSHTLHATGYAMGLQRDGLVGSGDPDRDAAVVTYFGDGATSQGDTNEALVFAAVNNAPVVLFCQNNQWAISEPTTRQSRVPIVERGRGFGVPSVRVDGNDVLACYAVTLEALERARTGGGPTFVEAYTYRMGAHTTSDDPTRYRSAAEEEHWRRRDPIDRFTTFLRSEGLLTEEHTDALAAEAEALAVRLREQVRAMDAPPTSSMFDDVYATPHSDVERERAWFARYEASFADAAADGSGATASEGAAR